MKTNYVPALVMLLAGGVYCLLGIFYQTPLLEFSIQLLTVLIIFWIIGGIIRIVLDKYMGEVKDPSKEEDEEESSEEDASEESDDAEEDAEAEEE